MIHHRDPKVGELSRMSLFNNVPRKQLALVAANLDEVDVEAGQTLVREEHHNDAFWMSVDGRKTHELGPGDFFGATSMLDGKPAIATIVAKTPVKAFVASAAQFRAIEGNDAVLMRLMHFAIQRLREDLEIHLGRRAEE
jgi:CRP-like cAMP-binding protein